jgi:hypothetical protein
MYQLPADYRPPVMREQLDLEIGNASSAKSPDRSNDAYVPISFLENTLLAKNKTHDKRRITQQTHATKQTTNTMSEPNPAKGPANAAKRTRSCDTKTATATTTHEETQAHTQQSQAQG